MTLVSFNNILWTLLTGDGVLQIIMLKRSRKGHYVEGEHNASTWWASLFNNAGPLERICLQNPPTSYFWAEYDEDDIADS